MSDGLPNEEMTLRDYASVIWRRKWIVILPMVVTTLVAVALSSAQTPMYRASAQVLVKTPATAYSLGSSDEVLTPRLVENELQAAKGSALETQVRETIGTEPTLSVTVSEGSDVFTFTATSSDPELAAMAANTFAASYIARQRLLVLDEYAARVEVLNEQLAAIERGEVDPARQSDYEFELEDLAVSTELAKTSGSTLIDAATPPGSPYEPNTMRTATLALVVGLLIGLGAAFLLDYMDTSIRDEDDLTRASGLPNLASIPGMPARRSGDTPFVVARESPQSPGAEAFRSLQTAIKFLGVDRPLRTLLVTSPRPGEGKTTTATNLAITAARSGQRVVLVDCDLRKPQVHLFFSLPNTRGFTSVLLGDATMRQVATVVADAQALAIVPSGPIPPNTSELLSGERTKASIETLSNSVDLVILDSPPVLPVSDPVILASLVDGVIVVASVGTTDRRQLSKAIARLEQVDAPLLGTVLNRYDPIASTDYTYGYAESSKDKAKVDKAKAQKAKPDKRKRTPDKGAGGSPKGKGKSDKGGKSSPSDDVTEALPKARVAGTVTIPPVPRLLKPPDPTPAGGQPLPAPTDKTRAGASTP